MRFSQDEITTLTGALMTAAERYRECAKVMRETPGHDRMAEQFDRQAAAASALFERIEQEAVPA